MSSNTLTTVLLALVTVLTVTAISECHADTVLRRTTLLVRELDRSLEFYRALGFDEFYDASRSVAEGGSVIGGEDLPLAGEPGDSRIVVLTGPDPDTGMVGLLAYTSPALDEARLPLDGIGQGDVVLMLQVDDIELSRKAMVAIGARFHREPYRYEVRNNEGQIRASGWRMFVYDPDGRLIEIAQRDSM